MFEVIFFEKLKKFTTICGRAYFSEFVLFPNRGLRPIRVLIAHQRGGYTETDTRREAFAPPSPPGSHRHFSFRSSSYPSMRIARSWRCMAVATLIIMTPTSTTFATFLSMHSQWYVPRINDACQSRVVGARLRQSCLEVWHAIQYPWGSVAIRPGPCGFGTCPQAHS